MLDISESYILSVDSSENDHVMVLSVTKWSGSKLVILSTFHGEEAEELYYKLTGKDISGKGEMR